MSRTRFRRFRGAAFRFRDWGNLLLLGIGAWTAVGVFAWQAGWPPADDVLFLPVMPVAALLAWRVSGSQGDVESRRAWRVVGLGFLLYGAGDAIWIYLDLVPHVNPFPSLADPFFLVFYPLLLWGLLAFPSSRAGGVDRCRLWIDVSIVLTCVGMLFWYFAADRLAWKTEAGFITNLIARAYPVADLVLYFGAVTMIMRSPRDRRLAWNLLAAGAFLFALRDALFAFAGDGAFRTGDFTVGLWLMAEFAFALAPQVEYLQGRSAAGASFASRSGYGMLLPYGATLLAAVLALIVAQQGAPVQVRVLSLMGFVVVCLVLLRLALTVRDQTRLRLQSEEREARFRSLVQQASDVISILDENLTLTYLSPAAQQVFGLLPTDLAGRGFPSLFRGEEEVSVRLFLQEVAGLPGAVRRVEWRYTDPQAQTHMLEVTTTNLLLDPAVGGLVLNIRDISDRTRLEEQIWHQAHHDSLTGLANRELFRDRLRQALANLARSGAPVSVLFVDIDDFKTINDSLGHTMGDRMLVELGRRIAECLKGRHLLARIGGDEFALLMVRVGQEEAIRIAQAVVAGMRAPLELEGRRLPISISAGLATSVDGSEGVDDLLRNADLAMYVAKGAGKDRCQVYHSVMYEENRNRMQLREQLILALENRELLLHYQPIVLLGTGEISGFEALIRWQHPQKGLLYPAQFLSIAEESSLMPAIGRWVIAEACRQLRQWTLQYPVAPDFAMFVNLSMCQLELAGFSGEVARTIAETGIDPRRLVLEITESGYARRKGELLQTLQELKRIGVRLAIDDFGTGYSSFSYLRTFPVDILKIDKSFTREIDADLRSRALLMGIIDLARGLHLEAVAEGIEQQHELDRLHAMGCPMGQGYLFSHPLPAEAMAAELERRFRPRTVAEVAK